MNRDPYQIRKGILQGFPWVLQENQTMVIGTDLDALMSAMFMNHHFGWKLIGVYNLQMIYFAEGCTIQDLKSAIWIDLDIAHPEVRSIGHHILTNQPTDYIPGLTGCLNPNLLRGVSVRKFERKYPLATLHLLMWLTDKPEPGYETDKYLLWLPDSCWITAQGKYLPNVRDWLHNWMPVRFLLATVEDCQTEEYEDGMKAFLEDLTKHVRIAPGRGQTKSKHLQIGGYQFRFSDPGAKTAELQEAIEYIARLSGWNPLSFPTSYQTIRGIKNRHETDLRDFIERENIFSYVIRNPGVINFTSFEEFRQPK